MPTLRTRSGKGSALTHAELDANFKRTVAQKTTTYQVLISDNRSIIEGNHADTPFTITLPPVATADNSETGDFEVTITNINAAVVTVDGSGAETINGAANVTLEQWEAVTCQLDSAQTGWATPSRTLNGSDVTLGTVSVGGDIPITEASDHTTTPAAGKGIIWAKNDTPTSLQYTDDAGTDYPISTHITPVGGIMAWPTASPPTGWLECDGTAVSRTTYATLFALIASTYGDGDGSTTFNLPDYRGEFLRGWDNSAGTDPDAASRTDRGDTTTGDNVGTKQADAFQTHQHPRGAVLGGSGLGGDGGSWVSSSTDTNPPEDGRVSSETRPTNVNVMWIIKF